MQRQTEFHAKGTMTWKRKRIGSNNLYFKWRLEYSHSRMLLFIIIELCGTRLTAWQRKTSYSQSEDEWRLVKSGSEAAKEGKMRFSITFLTCCALQTWKLIGYDYEWISKPSLYVTNSLRAFFTLGINIKHVYASKELRKGNILLTYLWGIPLFILQFWTELKTSSLKHYQISNQNNLNAE